MSDAAPPPAGPPPFEQNPGAAYEVDVDITTFLPEGTELSDQADGPDPVAAHAPAAAADVADLAELERIELELAAVDEALTRLDDGTYGRCAACGEAIADDRLADDPTTTGCGAHA